MKRSVRKFATQWAELVTSYNASSESEREFCTRHNVKLASLRKWRYHYNPKKQKPRLAVPTSSFVQVDVRESRVPQESVVLCIGSQIRLECPSTFDVASLAELALAIHRGC